MNAPDNGRVLPESERAWPPPYWFAWFCVLMLLSLLFDALIPGQDGEWIGGVFFGIGIGVLFMQGGKKRPSDDHGTEA